MLPDHVRVLADIAEKADEIDVERAPGRIEARRGRVKDPREQNTDISRAINAMNRAKARLEAAGDK